jgi:asparagine synthase (glutamine-hydrolysing)
MSLIAGLVYRDPSRPVEPAVLAALVDGSSAAHPRESRLDSGAAFVAGGPGASVEACGPVVLAADVDVTNADDLLRQRGLTTLSELIHHLYESDGRRFPLRLRGGFALALWYPDRRRLVLAADRFGIRRIYYAANEHGLAWSSRVRGALAIAPGDARIDSDAVYAYLNFGTIPAPQTVYAAVRRLPPGHVLIWENGRVFLERYWDMSYPVRPTTEGLAVTAVRQQTRDAVREALCGADLKRTGAFLSGGTDSSTIVGLMKQVSDERVNAFSIGFAEERYDELRYAELAAQHFEAAHYTHLVTPDDAFAALPDVVAAYDEPFGNNSALPTYLCARLARDTGMRLLLAGDGGDEIFGGNERYRREYVLSRYRRIPWLLRRGIIEPILQALPDGGATLLGKGQRYVRRASMPNPDRFYSSEFYVSQERSRLLSPEFLAAIRPDWPLEIARAHYEAAPASTEIDRLLYLDLKITIGDNDLFKVTRTAELAGIGVRFPMLDHPLAELTGGLPAAFKVRAGEKRYIFKRAFAPLLPAEILQKVKHGFGLPVSHWLKTHPGFRELARDTLLSAGSRGRGYYAPGALESLFRLHETDATPFYGDILWTLLMLELWHRRHGDRA